MLMALPNLLLCSESGEEVFHTLPNAYTLPVGTTVGSSMKAGPCSFKTALEQFKEVYYDRTGNNWEDRETAEKKAGRYFPLETTDDDTEANKAEDDEVCEAWIFIYTQTQHLPSYLDPRVKEVVELIFDVDMMSRELKELEVDVRKMPLGKISPTLLTKGYEVLRQIEEVLLSKWAFSL